MLKSRFAKAAILSTMLLGLPLLGIFISQKPIGLYLEFPPQTRYIQQAPFSWVAFGVYGFFVTGIVIIFFVQSRRAGRHPEYREHAQGSFPWWGWLGICWGIAAWVLAWSRFEWFGKWQPHSFAPLWVGYILTVNALTYRRKGFCLLSDQTAYFLRLFPLSAVFWWFFEYLNRFVQNWYYVGPDFGPWEYFWYATLPFSTVLPAVMSTRQYLLSFGWPKNNFQSIFQLNPSHPRMAAGLVMTAAGSGLAGIGIWPNLFFPLLWVAPLLIIVCLQTLWGEDHIFSSIVGGDWHVLVACALSALICGFFWEMWNFHSLAKWRYSIPFVHRFKVFEMPILGYAGYLPFGIECAVVAEMVRAWYKD